MDNAIQYKSTVIPMACLSVCAFLSACGGGTGGADEQEKPYSDAVMTTGNAQIAEDPGSLEFIPSPGAGLEIDYEMPEQDLSSSNDFIESQWVHMQTCLQVSAQEPKVNVIDGQLKPVDSNDDVVRHIDGQVQASVHVTNRNAVIQVRAADFDGSLGKPGSYLRSIMGRYLWLANSLPERDYPFNCAKGN